MEERRAGSSQILDMLERIHCLQLDQAKENGKMQIAIEVHTVEIKGLKATDNRQWLATLVGPFLVIGYGIARKMGVNV